MIKLIKKIPLEWIIVSSIFILISIPFGIVGYIGYLESCTVYDECTVINCNQCVHENGTGWLIEVKTQDGTIKKLIRDKHLLPTGDSQLLIGHKYSYMLPYNEIISVDFIANNQKIVRIP